LNILPKNSNSKNLYKIAAKNPVRFWEDLAWEGIFWREKWRAAFVHQPPFFQWFVGGKLNIAENCLDRHLPKLKDKPAIIWESELLEEKPRIITYRELFSETCRFANALKKLGVKKGDRVGIYLPMIPEAVISMLACARIGAVHAVVFSAFSPAALKVRLQDTEAKILITADGYFRRGQIINLKNAADQAVPETAVEKIVVVKRSANEIRWKTGRDLWWHELIKDSDERCEAETMDAEDPLFILYTSGSTGKPKGCLHTAGGYSVQSLWTGKWIFDFRAEDIFWCTADIGWITGHTYGIYSPLLNGITTLMFEGAPDFPKPDRAFQIIEKHGVTIFYTAPTAIRMFAKYGLDFVTRYELKTLRLLGSVGEPIDEDAWQWYWRNVGKEKCEIVDTWWQTETGGILISSLPGIGPFKPGFAGRPFPGVKVEIRDGNLLILPPFAPGMFRTIYKNPKKYQEIYWSQYGPETYFTSDAALKDENGLIRILGRVDDVIKVAGHRLSTGELENAVNKSEQILECAVIGIPDEIKGEAIVIFAVPEPAFAKASAGEERIKNEVINQLKKEIGPIALPKEVYAVSDLPKTRSGKIMRRILKKLLANEDLDDLSTLSNPETVEKIQNKLAEARPL
jgi:acetyl-CoA synthetase